MSASREFNYVFTKGISMRGRTANEIRRDLALFGGVQDLLDARLLAQLLRADLVPRRRERQECVYVRKLETRTPSRVNESMTLR